MPSIPENCGATGGRAHITIDTPAAKPRWAGSVASKSISPMWTSQSRHEMQQSRCKALIGGKLRVPQHPDFAGCEIGSEILETNTLYSEPVKGQINIRGPKGLTLYRQKNDLEAPQAVASRYIDGHYQITLDKELKTYWLFLQ